MVLSLPPQPQQVITLQSCMEYALASERLVGDNQFYCDKCDKKQDATKTVTLHRCPQTLIVSFCRTLWNKTKGLHKDSRRVQFPLELDATPWLTQKDESGWEDIGGGCHYRLTAIVSHSGTSPLCGHYIAWCRVRSEPPPNNMNHEDKNDEGKWYLFNDSHVSPAKEEQVLDAEAFILMYERRQVLPSDKMELGG
jgi:ubiquitin C-terminal hydrolase